MNKFNPNQIIIKKRKQDIERGKRKKLGRRIKILLIRNSEQTLGTCLWTCIELGCKDRGRREERKIEKEENSAYKAR